MGQDACESFSPGPGMTFSRELFERLLTGTVSEERIAKYENNWINKLAKLDEDHALKNRLCVEEAEPILKNLEEFATSGTPMPCSEHQKLTMRCSEVVESFANCVDELLSKSCRENNDEPCSKRLSYTEKFASNFNCN